MATETNFKITVSDAALSALQNKLAHATLPDELDEAGWDYGVPLADVRRLITQWTNGYDWRAHEAALNAELPQFTRDIEIDDFGTLNIHYVHKRSEVDSAIPLLFVHGWPGSFIEVRKILPLLTAKPQKDDHPSFHVVALSLPGFGFSEAPHRKGFAAIQYAEITGVNANMNGPKHVKAWHTNGIYSGGSPPTIWTPLRYLRYLITPLSAAEKAGQERSRWFITRQNGYYEEQSTQPQTLGYALADSPVGLLAWIYEKLVQWTDSYPWEDDEVLTWVSIYLFSRAAPRRSLRIYYEELIHQPKS
ncbi:hypothetical protein EWM64_g4132 [Hericium alpestre]|uniref:Epoxide hydrolase N-terminal domain-containing protein n=1 Tax=Hericium alpestre TaxID=135208 RepID=A0A4Z0A0L8_9AGAM|nr:hypothetical protein EWM64_g4132 [Hericium alpestre]